MDPLVTSSLIAGGQQAAGGLFGWLGAKRQRKFQREMADYAYTKDLEMWQRQNEYNTPEMQRKRMEEAGLNPALMYKGTPQNVATQMPKHQRWDTPTYSHEMDIGGILGQYADLKIKNAQAKKLNAEANWADKQAGETVIGLMYDNWKKSLGQEERFTNLGKGTIGATSAPGRPMELEKYEAEVKNKQIDNALKKELLELRKKGLENASPFVRAAVQNGLIKPEDIKGFVEFIRQIIKK